ncbi:hypothetical protein SLS60_001427 [Paraconiothyrium brasiliense]|uniref:Uncharacterized protein n=1 Tax=Paraconiothyrium brasiliense TaxID=300254 RepID=A0ABR3S920_9PLEO
MTFFDGKFPFRQPDYPYHLDYATFENWLLMHKDTLKHISIGDISQHSDRRSFNATLFPHLEYLKLSRWQMHGARVEFRTEDADLIGPRLKTFCWDFTGDFGNAYVWWEFGKAEALWLEKFAKEAIARKAVLQTFEILFDPDRCSTVDAVWPWDLMDDLRERVFRPNAMDFVYATQ